MLLLSKFLFSPDFRQALSLQKGGGVFMEAICGLLMFWIGFSVWIILSFFPCNPFSKNKRKKKNFKNAWSIALVLVTSFFPSPHIVRFLPLNYIQPFFPHF